MTSQRFLSDMASRGRWTLWTVWSSFLALENVALRVTMRESSVDVVRGDSVVLPCSFFTSTPLSRLNVIWTLVPFSDPEAPIQVIVYDHGQVMEDPSLTGRVGFTGLPWTADLALNDTRVSDAGVYRCMVNNPPEAAEPEVGELQLRVLTAPSLPVCRWDGDVDVGGKVTLSCSVSEGVPAPRILWTKVHPEEVSLPIGAEEGDRSGSVQIANVSAQTSGLYRCSASNLLGTENCYVSLTVYSAPQTGSSSGVLQGVLLSLSMGLVLAALLALMMWLRRTGQDGRTRRRRKESKDEGEEEEECYNEIAYTPSLMKRSFV